jgi:hypothetical protein
MVKGPKVVAGSTTVRVGSEIWPGMIGEDRKKKESIGMASRVIIVLQNFAVGEEYLVMAGVMDELRLDFGSPDVLFVHLELGFSISGRDTTSVYLVLGHQHLLQHQESNSTGMSVLMRIILQKLNRGCAGKVC